jgi:catechol 2,3-dioxygenase-like lactoylglutathione lyase family enzyme
MHMPTVGSMVSVTYVRDIDASRAFYGLLGFTEHSAGQAETSAWTVLQHSGLSVLLASTTPPMDLPPFPLLFYFYYDDLDAVVRALDRAGVPMIKTGHPPHALGGEVKLADPDGNTLLLGQRERSAAQPPDPDDDASLRFSLLREAATAVSARGGTTRHCQVRQCSRRAEVKLADSRGDAAWACLPHAEDMLVTVPTAFIASQTDTGINAFLSAHR